MDPGQILLNVGVSALFAFVFSGRLARRANSRFSRWTWFFMIWAVFIGLSFFSFNLP